MDDFMVGDHVVRARDARVEGVIERIIPAHMDKYPLRWVEAKAVVAWPRRRIGGSGWMRTTVTLKSLRRGGTR